MRDQLGKIRIPENLLNGFDDRVRELEAQRAAAALEAERLEKKRAAELMTRRAAEERERKRLMQREQWERQAELRREGLLKPKGQRGDTWDWPWRRGGHSVTKDDPSYIRGPARRDPHDVKARNVLKGRNGR